MKLFLILCTVCLSLSCNPHKISHQDHELIGIDDVLTIRYLGDAEEAEFKITGSTSTKLDKHESQLLEANVEIYDLENAIFSYELITKSKNISGGYDTIKNSTNDLKHNMLYWFGEDRKENYTTNTSLAGIVKNEIVDSKFLKSQRKITTYTPKDNSQDTPIIFLMDGQAVNNFAPYIDKLIKDKVINPVKLVGINSTISMRLSEYMTRTPKIKTFENHENFVFNEVIPKFHNDSSQAKKYLFGFSAGAAFTIYSGLNYPTLFKEVIAFSIAGYKAELPEKLNFNVKDYPSFYFRFGKFGDFENNVRNKSSLLIYELQNKNLQVDSKEFNSSHDFIAWRIEFLNYLKSRFKK